MTTAIEKPASIIDAVRAGWLLNSYIADGKQCPHPARTWVYQIRRQMNSSKDLPKVAPIVRFAKSASGNPTDEIIIEGTGRTMAEAHDNLIRELTRRRSEFGI